MHGFLTQTENERLDLPNGATREAATNFLGQRLGYPLTKVMSATQPFRRSIGGQLDRGRTVEDLLVRVWEQAWDHADISTGSGQSPSSTRPVTLPKMSSWIGEWRTAPVAMRSQPASVAVATRAS